jgi:hypothetical protein
MQNTQDPDRFMGPAALAKVDLVSHNLHCAMVATSHVDAAIGMAGERK